MRQKWWCVASEAGLSGTAAYVLGSFSLPEHILKKLLLGSWMQEKGSLWYQSPGAPILLHLAQGSCEQSWDLFQFSLPPPQPLPVPRFPSVKPELTSYWFRSLKTIMTGVLRVRSWGWSFSHFEWFLLKRRSSKHYCLNYFILLRAKVK